MDTIFALASAAGRAGVSVVRISGTEAFSCAERLCGTLPEPGTFRLRTLRHDGNVLDEALVLVFAAGHSFTGDPVVELHLHGSVAVVAAVLDCLGEMPGLRLAEPGEFTRRAMENGRLDLAQVEGLADLIQAETEAQRRQAFRVFSGALSEKAATWRSRLVRAAALMAAGIDFADEEIPETVLDEARDHLASVQSELSKELDRSGAAERVREGFEVAIVGPPNIGKSTLLNALAQREAAIVSPIAGTTRDVIEVRMDIGGLPVTLLDTAGLRSTEDEVEKIGVDRARERAVSADLRVFLTDESGPVGDIEVQDSDIVVRGKDDAGTFGGVSGMTRQGLDELVAQIGSVLKRMAPGDGLAIRERQRQAMTRAVAALGNAKEELGLGEDRLDFAAEDVRSAIVALDSIVGKVDVEDLLDDIFSSFCIGK